MDTILLTGGTGTFGRAFTRHMLQHSHSTIRIFSRDEKKQADMRSEFPSDRLRWLIGDVRDAERVRTAAKGCDTIIHAAAMKRVEACEYNPAEAIATNVRGAMNVINAALDCGVQKSLMLSTDKAAAPTNLYGKTKGCGEHLFTQANVYAEPWQAFSCTRYGNVWSSRGSVVEVFAKQAREGGPVTITDPRMTRFIITLDEAVDFVLRALDEMQGGEIFVPRLPSVKVTTIADAVAPDVEREVTGIRPGEKIHELMVTEHEARRTLGTEWGYTICPQNPFWQFDPVGDPVPEGWEYSSGDNGEWLTVDDIRGMKGAA